MNAIRDGQSIESVVGLLEMTDQSEETTKSLNLFKLWFEENKSKRLRKKLLTAWKQGAEEIREKFDRDAPILRNLSLSHDERVPFTNRRIESVFASYKALHARLMQMSDLNKASVTRARMNKTSSWLSEKTLEKRLELVNKSAEGKKKVLEERKKQRARELEEIANKYFDDLDSLLQE